MQRTDLVREIDHLGLSEKLLLVEDVWDSIAKENHHLPMPEWHKRELEKRYQEYREGKTELHDWASVHGELRNRFQ